MIILTPGAAEQIRRAAHAAGQGLHLRVAARRAEDGSVDYGMGFDDWRSGDLRILCEGVALVVATPSRELVKGITIDYVEIAPGDSRFIFAAASAAPRTEGTAP